MTDKSLPITGKFYLIYRDDKSLVLEDRTKRGLEVRERNFDDEYSVIADKGMIYDVDGIGHKVGIRWFFPASQYHIQDVLRIADGIEQRYKAIQEITCPDDTS